MVRKCNICGASIVDDNACFCDQCGLRIPTESIKKVVTCKNCGNQIKDIQSLFCDKCGTPLKKSLTEKNYNSDIPQSKQKMNHSVETPKKYAHIPLVPGDSKGRFSISDEKISINTTETLPKRKNIAKKRIQETRCTCLACGKIWYYGKSEVLSDFAAKTRNVGKDISACSCCWPMAYMSREKTDINKCPNCGSKAVKKEQITHEVA
jgi:ribosomal protein L37E/DNA-directed RNA polymerase subunit RPC12/RpoP